MSPLEDVSLSETTLPVSAPGVPLQLIEQQNRALEGIATALALLVRRQDDLEALTEQARLARDENNVLRAEIGRLRLLVDSSEKIHQQDMDQIRTWLGRLARAAQSGTAVGHA